MILRRLHLQRFGRFREASWEFAPGLTVIRGPNEAGKSTMREAVVRLLFDRTIVGTTSRNFLALRSWGEERDFVLSGTLEAQGATLTLTKDFDADSIELREGDRVLTDEGAVNERLAELLGERGRNVYETTACLRQQEFAALAAGREVSALLQQTLAGPGAEAGVQEVLEKLNSEVRKLATGLRGAYKTPGPVKAAQLEREELARKIAELRPVVQRAEDARRELDALTQRATEIETELDEAKELLERVERRMELQRRLDEVSKQCARLEATTREARRLGERMEELQARLHELPDISDEQVADVRELVTQRAEAEKAHLGASAEAKTRESAEAEAQERLAELEAGLPDPERLRAAEERHEQIRTLTAELEVEQARAASARAELEAARARRTNRRLLLGIGIALAATGLGTGLGLGAAWGWAVAVAGALLTIGAILAVRQIGATEARGREQAAQARIEELQAAIDAAREELGELLGPEGDLSALRARMEQASDERDTARDALTAAREATRAAREAEQRTRQALEIAAARLDHQLAELGFDAVDAVEAAAREVADLEQELRDARTRRDTLLGGRTLEELDAEFGRINADRRGLEDELNSPELAVVAEKDAEEHVRLGKRLRELDKELENLEKQIATARAAAGNPEADAGRLRELEDRHAAAGERLQALEERLAVLQLTHELLKQAHEETLADAIDVLEPQSAELLAGLTNGRYVRIEFDRANLAPRVYSDDKGGWVTLDGTGADPPTALSCATREQVYLAARLALTRLLWPEELPPIMLDDPFVNFDAERRRNALAVVRELASEAQVLLFTCDPDYDDFADEVIELPAPCDTRGR